MWSNIESSNLLHCGFQRTEFLNDTLETGPVLANEDWWLRVFQVEGRAWVRAWWSDFNWILTLSGQKVFPTLLRTFFSKTSLHCMQREGGSSGPSESKAAPDSLFSLVKGDLTPGVFTSETPLYAQHLEGNKFAMSQLIINSSKRMSKSIEL